MSVELLGAGEPSGLRASHADRDRVVDVLSGAAGDGRITAEELDERVAAALCARTLGELAVLTADLPDGSAVAPVRDVARIEQKASSTVRADGWVVPRRLEIDSSWGDVTLDFSRAVITHDTLTVELSLHAGALRLLTRPGVVVDTDSLVIDYGQVKTRSAKDARTPVVLRVEIRGRMSYGQVVVRPARRRFGRKGETA
ncbi:DUF1707 SHOCT-like domain-containing protein [Streptomyces sp. NPDC002676]